LISPVRPPEDEATLKGLTKLRPAKEYLLRYTIHEPTKRSIISSYAWMVVVVRGQPFHT
jgi:hypothetical protein